jgi:hypothetical protein
MTTGLVIGGLWLSAVLLLTRWFWANSERRDSDTLERMWALSERSEAR